MWQEKLKKKTMNVSQIIVVTLLEERKQNKKIIMTKQQQLIYGSCIYQTTYYWWPQARMGVFYCVCKSSFRILKRVLWDRVLIWTKVCWCMWDRALNKESSNIECMNYGHSQYSEWQ